jgi:hypothetical protein
VLCFSLRSQSLSRSNHDQVDVALWHIASYRYAAEFGRYRGIADVYAEKEFVNHDDLKQLTLRHEAQFDDLRQDLKGITTRLDRLLESRIPLNTHA